MDESYLQQTGTPHVRWREQVAARPRVFFRCGRDWMTGPDWFEIGVLWDRDFDATPGQSCYRKEFVLRWRFNLRLTWR